jgi:nucleoporin p58/p45
MTLPPPPVFVINFFLLNVVQQVESTEKHMRSLATQQTFTSQDLKKGLQQMHESFVALAGRLHETHQKVEQQKEQYLNFQKYYNRNTTNPFDVTSQQELQNSQYKTISAGPTPFSTIGNLNLGIKNVTNLTSGASISNPWGNISTNSTNMPSFGLGQSTSNTFGGGSTSFNFSTGNQDGGGFALQKPPIGTKRNKH